MPGQPLKITIPHILVFMTLYLALLPFINYPLTTLIKPIPILLLLLFTLQNHPSSQIKKGLLVALMCAVIGDIVLTIPTKWALEAGIGAFMVTNSAYIYLFLTRWQFQKKQLIPFLPLFFLILGAFYYLWPYMGDMRLPITLYLNLLTFMVFCAFQIKNNSILIKWGAVLFLFSDFFLALNLFVIPHNRVASVLIMLFYYFAQLFLVLGIIQPKRSILQRKPCRVY